MMACISMYARLCKHAYHNISCILARVPVEETSKEIVTVQIVIRAIGKE